MSPENFERRWNGLRRHLLRVATGFPWLDDVDQERAVGETLVYLLKSLPRLPEHQENGFELGRYARLILKHKALDRTYFKKPVKTVPLLAEQDKKTVECAAIIEAAMMAYHEAEERREAVIDAKKAVSRLLSAVENVEDRRILFLMAYGWSQTEVAEKMGVSRQRIGQRYHRAREAALRALQAP